MPRRQTVAGVPADLATIARDVGSLLVMQSGLMVLSVGVAVAAREPYAAGAFLLAAAPTGVVGLVTRRRFADAPAPRMKHGMVVAAAGWFATAVFGALPFLLTAHLTPPAVAADFVPPGADYAASSLAYFRNPLHALFESMSG